MLLYLIPLLFAASIAGLVYVLLRALQSGAESYAGTYSADTARQFEDVFLFIPPRRVAEMGWAACAVAFITVFLFTGSLVTLRGFLVGLVLAAAAGLAALYSPRVALAVLKKRRLQRFNVQLVDALITMSNALKAGFSINQALESVVREGENPLAQEFAVVLQQMRIGVPFSEALSNLEERVGSDDLTLVVLSIEATRKTGGNLTEVFEKIAGTIRERMRIEKRILTLTAQGRLQGAVAGTMPIFIGVLMMVVDPGLMRPFLHSTFGAVAIAAVAVLVAAGFATIRKIVNIDI